MCGAELVDASRRFCGGETCERVFLERGGREAVTVLGRGLLVVLTLVLSLAVTRTASGEVPSPADIAACNEEAPRAIKAGSASPTGGDHARAAGERGTAATPTATEIPGSVIQSADPQIHGMQGAGAKNADYQAAYRSCMRRKGF
jgi:hypothetical protein